MKVAELTLPTEKRNDWITALEGVSHRFNIVAYLSDQLHSTHPTLNDPALNTTARSVAHSFLGKPIEEALHAMAEGRGPDILVLHNMPIDPQLPPTPSDNMQPFSKEPISELVLRSVAAHLSDPNHYYQMHVAQVVESRTAVDKGIHYHSDGADKNGNTPIDFSALLCLRGDDKARTFFADPKQVNARSTPTPSDQALKLTLRPGDMVIFNNRTILHGREPCQVEKNDNERRWVQSAVLLNLKRTEGAVYLPSTSALVGSQLGAPAR